MATLRLRSGQFLAIIAIAGMLAAGYTLRREPGSDVTLPANSIIIIVVGAAVLAFAVWLLKPPIDAFTITQTSMEIIPINWLFVVLGVAALAGFIAKSSEIIPPLSIHQQMALFVGGIALITLGFCGVGRNLFPFIRNIPQKFKVNTALFWFGLLE